MYLTFTTEYKNATYLFHAAEADRSLGLIEPAKDKLRQVQSELADCDDAMAKSLMVRATNLLNELS